ncbi:MAG: division/cell wall cluster transcriptional repressor MraZ [Candidatus Ratteibacteria bacterium]|nr:division/cell wall cluster transcriptional repressor MraZ [Candidatus Ratteibacteria bacterium]
MVYFGEFRGKVDKQGRIVIPSKMRGLLSVKQNGVVYITKGLENCLFIFSEKMWESQSTKLKDLPFTKGNPRTFTRLFFSGAFQSHIDKQGRILIPANLLNYACIQENIVIIGAGTRVEVWDEKKWNEYYEQSLKIYEDISEKLMEM